jgi:hypothetical protein
MSDQLCAQCGEFEVPIGAAASSFREFQIQGRPGINKLLEL